MKIVLKLVLNTALGGAALALVNLAGGLFGFHVALNLVSALVAGVLGIPGVALLVILKFLFKA